MRYRPEIHHRRSIRLAGYDYSQPGVYFVTLSAFARERLFGQVINGAMTLNAFGSIALREWLDLPTHYPHVRLDAFVIMPNHMHGIICLAHVGAELTNVGAGYLPCAVDAGHKPDVCSAGFGRYPFETRPYEPVPTRERLSRRRDPLPEIVRGFKAFSTRQMNAQRKSPGCAVWQRNYYERIIRDERELTRTQVYPEQSSEMVR